MAKRNTGSTAIASATCPSCGDDLGTAFIQQLSAPHVARAMEGREQELITQARAEAAAEIAALQAAADQAQVQLLSEREHAAEERTVLQAEVDQARAAEKKVRQDRRKLELERDAWVIEQDRMRDEVRSDERKLAEQYIKERVAQLTASNEQKLQTRLRELEEHNKSLAQQLQDAHRKSSMGPRPQQEGVAYQEVLAAELRSRFPEDEVTVIPRGKRGSDVVQQVREKGREYGTIVWECKQAQRFEPKWITKLGEDVEFHSADIGVLVSSVLPRGIEGSGQIDGVLVCETTVAVHVAVPLRQYVISRKRFALANAAREDQAGWVYDFVTVGGFGPCMEHILKAARTGMAEMAKLREYSLKFWANWEKSQQDMIDGVFTMIGELGEAGTKLPAPLQAELPSAECRALEPGTD
ncbi:DUF2130 domain-containing protein [Nocardia arthritidis]|uniref:DUF2130 domain-containing protein n=1 Tax=Nocardia arthritidis TaxID=228602 RepID=A0A6G9Y9S8_9NOCA|nr:DUF2130 domain-containing protein [Nocardia arthritidis]QIS09803.1 DUF2130 domain-containing protein [Nocardia arthritidis]